MMNKPYKISVLFFGMVTSAMSFDDDGDRWFLMSRHGECAELQSLQRKIPDVQSITTPETFIELMKEKGLKVNKIELTEFQGQAVQIDVPEKGLNLIFVKSTMCK